MSTDTKSIEALMKRCQVGVGGRHALDDAHSIMADCYGSLGALVQERDRLAARLAAVIGQVAMPIPGLEPHQQRVLDELAQLEDRRTKLGTFINGKPFEDLPAKDRQLLIEQFGCMTTYTRILNERVRLFNRTDGRV